MIAILLQSLLAYLISLAANERSSSITTTRQRKLKELTDKDEALQKALRSVPSLRDELYGACAELARHRGQLGISPQEEPLWRLLSDQLFQKDLADWLMTGGIAEGNASRRRLQEAMETALTDSGGSPAQVDFIRTGFFDAVEKAVFAHPILAH